MPEFVESPTVVESVGNMPKRIEEYMGRVNTGDEAASVARMVSPAGWQEPGQRPRFDEMTLVLQGALRVEFEGGEQMVRSGQAVIARGTTVFLRGQCPQNLDDAKNIDSHDPVDQTHKVMQNIRQLIEEAGGNMTHLVKVVVYITDVRHREAVYRTMGEYIRGVHPVSTGLVVQALARPDWLVEIDATAVIPDEA